MRVKCPRCGSWVDVVLPLTYTQLCLTATCPGCGGQVSVTIAVQVAATAYGVGPSEFKASDVP